jgi:hypothetical protein
VRPDRHANVRGLPYVTQSSTGVDGRHPPQESQHFTIVGSACVVALVALVLLGVNTLEAGFACHGENIECAYSASKNGVYTGAFRGAGSPRLVEASFGSLLRSSVPLDVAPDGHYCLVWTHEREASAIARVEPPPLATGPSYVPLGPWHATQGRSAPPGCQTSSMTIPWDLASDLFGSWQFVLLTGLAAAALAGTILLAFVRRASRPVLLVMCAGALIADVVLSATLWTQFG